MSRFEGLCHVGRLTTLAPALRLQRRLKRGKSLPDSHRASRATVFGSDGINLPIRLPEEAVPNVVYVPPHAPTTSVLLNPSGARGWQVVPAPSVRSSLLRGGVRLLHRLRGGAGLPLPPSIGTCGASADQMGGLQYRSGRRGAHGNERVRLRTFAAWRRDDVLLLRRLGRGLLFDALDPSVVRRGGAALAPLGDGPRHKLHPRLRLPHRDIGAGLFRRRDAAPKGLPFSHRPGVHLRSRYLHPRNRRHIQPPEATHPVFHRPPLLSKEVRRRKDP